MSDPVNASLNGGCACGAIRYEFSGEPEVTLHCHCLTCQRQSSSPFMNYFITSGKDGFTVIKGKAKGYASSEKGKRYFCEECGTPMFFQYNDLPDRFVVSQGTLDTPNSLPPMLHIHTAESPVWFDIPGDAPQFPHDYVEPE